jgi:TetR/AcrR family transcriptional regulator, transcriptional repressor for nem operon
MHSNDTTGADAQQLTDSASLSPSADQKRTRVSTREKLVRAGVVMVLERGWAGSSIDALVKQCGVPKGSFYHYFSSKDEFGYAVLDSYQAFFMQRLHRWFGPQSPSASMSERFAGFLADSQAGITAYDFRRGCLIGALGQEVAGLHDEFRQRLAKALNEWDEVLARCLARTGTQGDCLGLAQAFWASWEGAVLRAMLSHNPAALHVAVRRFLASL